MSIDSMRARYVLAAMTASFGTANVPLHQRTVVFTAAMAQSK